MFRRSDGWTVLFSVAWSALAVFLTIKAWAALDGRQAPLSAWLVTVTFFPYGQYLLWGRLIFERWLRPRTFYFLTDRRVFALQKVSSWRIAIHNIEDIAQVRTYDVRKGRGTVRFSCKDDVYAYPSRENLASTPVWIVKGFDPAFIDLPQSDLRSVVAIVEAQRMNPRGVPGMAEASL